MAAFKNVFKLFPRVSALGHVKNGITINNIRNMSKTPGTSGLMEFFDVESNWGTTEVKSGRSWRKEELRLKSNSDLHKLWFVLLKERNMLLTMEEEAKNRTRLFQSPERLDKVEDSMENLECVVKERNEAYYELETGTTERKVEEVIGPFGLPQEHVHEEYAIPKHMNEEWIREHTYDNQSKDVKKFLTKYREQERLKYRQKNTRDFNHVIGLLKRFPDLDETALKEQYPNVDIAKAKASRKCRGHFVPK